MLRSLGNCLRWFALSAAVTALALAATGGIFAMLVLTAPALTRELGTVAGLALFGACLPLMLVLAAGLHEAGHLLAGVCVGFRPRFAHVGPITWTRELGGWRFGWDWRRPWLGGRAVCTIRTTGRWRVVIFLLGGPFANLASGLAAVGLVVGGLPALPRCALGLFAIHSLLLGIANLLPLQERWLDSDGLAVWRLFGIARRGRIPPPRGILSHEL